MSGNPGALPRTEWMKWLEEIFNPHVENEASQATRVEARLQAIENHLWPSEPEDPEEPQEPQEPQEPESPQEPEEPEEPQPAGFSDDTHKVALIVNPNFDSSNPTRRDGKPMTASEQLYYKAMMRGLLRADSDKYTGEEMFSGGNTYYIGRHGQIQQEMSLAAMSRSGDARILDEFVERWDLAYDELVVPWRADNIDITHRVFKNLAGAKIVDSKWVLSGGKTPWSPHKKWLFDWGEPAEGRGSDLNNLQTIKPWAILTQFLWALEINRNKPSPRGFNYGAVADKWKPVLRGFIDTYTSNTGADWEDNYLGLDGGMLWGVDRTRAKPGQWPFFVRGEGHAIYNSMMLCFYCGLLGSRGWDIPNWQAAIPAADTLANYIRTRLYVETVDSKGKPALLARGGGKATVISATYTNYLGFSLQHIRDVGRWDNLFTEQDMVKLARSYVDMHRPDGTTKKNLACGVDRTGHGWDVSQGADRSVHQQVINGFVVGMLWEEGSYLFDVGTAAQSSSFGGGYENAKSHIIPSIQFVDSTGV